MNSVMSGSATRYPIRARIPTNKSRLTVFWSGNVTGRVATISWSLPKATRLPERVTVPISVPIMIVTDTSVDMSVPSAILP